MFYSSLLNNHYLYVLTYLLIVFLCATMNTALFTISIVDLIGYLASLVVLISFLNKNMKWLRILNSIGCALFVIYGFALDVSWPIVITNVSIMLINFYYLFLVKKSKSL